MKKSERQAIIARLIKEKAVATQNDLLELLQAEGVDATQATVSRDIKEMRVIKQNSPDGEYKYVIPSVSAGEKSTPGFMTLLLGSVKSTDIAMNTVVLKCVSGAAQAAAAALDNIQLSGVAGTLAGDDTIFVLCYSVEAAQEIKDTLDSIFGF